MQTVPDALGTQPFTSAMAAAHGISARMLRGSGCRRLLRDVYVSAALSVTPDVRARAAVLAAPAGVLSRASAVFAQRLPLAVGERPPERAHLTTPLGGPTADHRGLINHVEDLPSWQVIPTPSGPATSPARTFLDRAGELRLGDLVGLGDAILRRPLATRADLGRVIDWAAGRRGVAMARRALPMLDPRSESAMESWLRVLLALAGLPAPEVNADIHDRSGCWIARVDLLFRAARLIVEYDGGVHLDERVRRADLQRRNLLTSEGWTVLHVTADDVFRRPHELVAMVAAHLGVAVS